MIKPLTIYSGIDLLKNPFYNGPILTLQINTLKVIDMDFSLPPIEKAPVPLPHFPTRQQAFIFRALEFFSYEKIAKIVKNCLTKPFQYDIVISEPIETG